MVVPVFRRITKTTCSSPSSTTTCSTQSGWARKLSPSSKGSCRRMSTRGSVVSRYNSIYVDICSLIITRYILESWRRGGHKASSVLQGCEMEGFRRKEDKAAIQTKNCKYGFWFHPDPFVCVLISPCARDKVTFYNYYCRKVRRKLLTLMRSSPKRTQYSLQ